MTELQQSDIQGTSWCSMPPDEVERRLTTSRIEGLSSSVASLRLRDFGPNSITDQHATTWMTVFARQFVDVLIWILIGAAAISTVIGEVTDAVTIVVIVVLNGCLGFVQEWKAERALRALREMLSPTCRVIRDAGTISIDASELVPGDIVALETGDRIPADLRLLQCTDLRIDESALTGESDSVDKSTDPIASDTGLASQSSMLWMGTSVTNGRCLASVVATGSQTHFGQIADLTSEIATDQTPLQRRLGVLGKQLGVLAIGVSLLVVVVGLLTGRHFVEMLMTGISLAVAVVPEGLPAVVTITLALGIRTMVRRNALLRRLQAAEAIGSATIVCTDKTGTLTQNQMTVQKIWLPGQPYDASQAVATRETGQLIDVTGIGYDPAGHFEFAGQTVDYRNHAALLHLLKTGMTCNHAAVQHSEGGWRELGEPTEAALVVASYKAWIDPGAVAEPTVEFAFSSDRRMMTVVTGKDQRTAHVKGAPEVILSRCSHLGLDRKPLLDGNRNHIRSVIESMGDEGLRTLAIACRTLPADIELNAADVERDLTFLGIVGIVDPPRSGVADAVAEANSAGIQIVMITGDAARTAQAIGKRIGLQATRAIEGRELAGLSDEQLLWALDGSAIFARTTPGHKLRIVRLLQSSGHVVGMTGDGVNDAPALKQADIGIAMGLRGTDVAKGAADIILTDDNFSSIVDAIEEGRRQYDNIQKFVRYLLSSNTGEAVAILVCILLGGPLILLPVQILWMNLITDSLVALALGLENAESDAMQRPPRDPQAAILDRSALSMIVGPGLYVGFMTLAIFQYFLAQNGEIELARTMAFHGIIVVEWFNVLNFRTLRVPVLKAGLFSNPWMQTAIAATLCVQLCALYVPFFQSALHTVPLTIGHWMLITLASLPVLLIGEAIKWWRLPAAGPTRFNA